MYYMAIVDIGIAEVNGIDSSDGLLDYLKRGWCLDDLDGAIFQFDESCIANADGPTTEIVANNYLRGLAWEEGWDHKSTISAFYTDADVPQASHLALALNELITYLHYWARSGRYINGNSKVYLGLDPLTRGNISTAMISGEWVLVIN